MKRNRILVLGSAISHKIVGILEKIGGVEAITVNDVRKRKYGMPDVRMMAAMPSPQRSGKTDFTLAASKKPKGMHWNNRIRHGDMKAKAGVSRHRGHR